MDDDYDNYSEDEEFHEDALNNEEYDALYAALPELKAQLQSYNPQIDDLSIKEALYYNYFEIPAALEELKSKFPKKKEDPPAPKLSKLAMLAKLRAGATQKAGLDLSGFSTPRAEALLQISKGGPVSGLAALARLRAKTDEKSGSGDRKQVISGSVATSPTGTRLQSLAPLKLGGPLKLGVYKAGSDKIQLSRNANSGGLELRRKLDRAKHGQPSPAPAISSVLAVSEQTSFEDNKEEHLRGLKRSALQLSFELSVDRSSLLLGPQNCVSVFLFEDSNDSRAQDNAELTAKRRKLSNRLFAAYTNSEANVAKAQANFGRPSPDDRVLSAQKQAFEVLSEGVKDNANAQGSGRLVQESTQALKKLSLHEKPAKETKPFKQIDVRRELVENPHLAKPSAAFVIIGHVDAGKLTLMGRVLYDTGTVDAKTVNRLVREAEKSGKGSFALAWVMDQTAEERARGVTIDICATRFETPSVRFTAIDAPGHRDFVPQMISGVSQADTALLVVDAIAGEFEAGFHMDGQTKEHALLARSLGIESLVVAVNKLDKEGWSEHRYADICAQLAEYLASPEIGFDRAAVSFVPVSGLTGLNVVANKGDVPEFAWYSGPTLVDRLEQIALARDSGMADGWIDGVLGADFSMAITEITDTSSTEFAVMGRIALGLVQPGHTVVLHPTEDTIQVQAVQLDGTPVAVAVSGQIVVLTFKLAQLHNKSTTDLTPGDIALGVRSPVRAVREFHANVSTFDMAKPLLVGTPFVLFRNSAAVAARISKVVRVNGAKKKKMHLVLRQTAEVVLEVLADRPLPVARFEDEKGLGRVVLRREGVTVAAGVVTQVG